MPSREGLRSPGRKVNSESLCAPGDQPEKKSEGEREKERHGDQSSDGAKVFSLTWCVYKYCLTKLLFLAKIKVKIPDLQDIGDPY